MLNAEIVGKYFLSKNHELTDIQIQKLTYYAYSWYMIKNNGEKIFKEQPQAWVHGPVFRSLYDAMKSERFYNEKLEENTILDSIKNFLEIIFNIYGKFSGNELEKMTHSETPWINARKGKLPHERSERLISDEDIMLCYGQ